MTVWIIFIFFYFFHTFFRNFRNMTYLSKPSRRVLHYLVVIISYQSYISSPSTASEVSYQLPERNSAHTLPLLRLVLYTWISYWCQSYFARNRTDFWVFSSITKSRLVKPKEPLKSLISFVTKPVYSVAANKSALEFGQRENVTFLCAFWKRGPNVEP